VAEALSNYSQQYVHMPGADERQRIMDRVYEVSGIPMVFGIVDGSHVQPIDEGSVQTPETSAFAESASSKFGDGSMQ